MDGIKDIFYVGYYHIKDGVVGCSDMIGEEWVPAIEYASFGVQAMMQQAKYSDDPAKRINANIHFIDMRTVITPGDIIDDGLHLNESGSKKVADLIYDALVKHNAIPYSASPVRWGNLGGGDAKPDR